MRTDGSAMTPKPARTLRLTFEDAVLEQLRAPEPYDVLLGAVARVQLESGGVVVYREELFTVAELALALQDWLRDGLPVGTDFCFDSVEHDEPGLVWCRSEAEGWQVGSIHADQADPVTHSSEEVAEAFGGFVQTVGRWVLTTTGRDLDALRTTPGTRTGEGSVGSRARCDVPTLCGAGQPDGRDLGRAPAHGEDRAADGAPSTIALDEVITLLRQEPGSGASAEIVDALSRLDPRAVLVLRGSSTNELRVTYERRAARRSSATGLDHLVGNLRRERASTVLLGHVELDAALVYLVLSDPPVRLLGCVVGPDRRTAAGRGRNQETIGW